MGHDLFTVNSLLLILSTYRNRLKTESEIERIEVKRKTIEVLGTLFANVVLVLHINQEK